MPEQNCFKTNVNPTCVELFITNSSSGFQNTIPADTRHRFNVYKTPIRRRVPTGITVTTGLSDRRKMVVTVLKESFQKVKLREVIIKSIKGF